MRKLYFGLLICLAISLNVKGQDLPTIGEVFDFQIGDEYHYVSSYGWWGSSYTINKINDVNYSLDSSDVIYSIFSYSYMGWILDSSAIFEADTFLITYTNLDSSLFYFDELFEHDTLHYFDDNFCGSEIYGAVYSSSGPWLDYTIREYGIGLGRTYFQNSSDTGTNSTGLVYYLKNGVECGSPIDISVGIDSPSNLVSISVFPTLFTNWVTIESEYQDELSVQVYSLVGHEILTKRLTSSSVQIDLGFVRSGTYIYVIRSRKDNHVIKTGRIIKG